jgi:hypothetical protein
MQPFPGASAHSPTLGKSGKYARDMEYAGQEMQRHFLVDSFVQERDFAPSNPQNQYQVR